MTAWSCCRIVATPFSESDTTELAALSPAQGLRALLEQTYRPAYVDRLGKRPEYFLACSAIANAVPAFRLRRPFDYSRLDEQADALEDLLGEVPHD